MTEQLALLTYTENIPNRIRDGQDKLWQRWKFIQTLPKDKRSGYYDGWDKGILKLRDLCSTTMLMGYNKCLYDTRREKPCFVCPMHPFDTTQCECGEVEL